MNTLLRLPRSLQFVRTYYFRKVKKGCECPEPPEPKEKIVQEKSCEPCCFETWKPKSRKCLAKQVQTFKKQTPRRRCYPGMVKKPPPECKKDSINPFAKKLCQGPKPPPPTKESPPPPKPDKPLPISDWDNC